MRTSSTDLYMNSYVYLSINISHEYRITKMEESTARRHLESTRSLSGIRQILTKVTSFEDFEVTNKLVNATVVLGCYITVMV